MIGGDRAGETAARIVERPLAMRAPAVLAFFVSTLFAPLLTSCAATEEATERGSSAIVVDDAHPAVVKVSSSAGRTCSGVLVASNVVLTARHCIADMDGDDVRCGANVLARSRLSAVATAPENVRVTIDDDSEAPLEIPVTIIHAPSDDVLCDGDIAALVLREKVPSTRVKPVPMRLDAPVAAGESLSVVGYGRQPDGTSGVRHRRVVEVGRVGPARFEGGRPTLGAHEIETNLGFCQGDSGGPALDRSTGAVVALVSRNESCSADHGYVFTLVSGFRTMIEQAFAQANAKLTHDAPDARGAVVKRAVGNECASADDCASGVCVTDLGAKYCSRPCHPAPNACPPEWSCNGVADAASAVCSRGLAPRVEAAPADVDLDAGEGHSSMSCSASPASVSAARNMSMSRNAPRFAFAAIIAVAFFCLLIRRGGVSEDVRHDGE